MNKKISFTAIIACLCICAILGTVPAGAVEILPGSTVSTIALSTTANTKTTVSQKTKTKTKAKKVKKRKIPKYTKAMKKRLSKHSNTATSFGWLGSESLQKKFSKYGAYTVGNQNKKTVFLTFDEGYEYKTNTVKILNTLKKKKIKATFFITMQFATEKPKLVKRMIKEGHTVGNHSTNHPDFTTLSTKAAYKEIKTLHDYVYKNFGYNMELFRFPQGRYSNRLLALTKEMGYHAVFWNFAQRDWDPQWDIPKSQIKNAVLSNTKNGSVYLLHAVSPSNVKALPSVIKAVKKNGYKFGLLTNQIKKNKK